MDTDLSARLDRAIGPAPDGPDPLAGLLDAGRSRVRRRRWAAAAASAAGVLVLGGGVALGTGGGADRHTAPLVADDPTTVATDASAAATPAPDLGADLPADIDLATYDERSG